MSSEIIELPHRPSMFEAIPSSTHSYSIEDNETGERIPRIHQVAREGNVEELQYLLEKGDNPNVTDRLSRTALHYAVSIECRCFSCLTNAETCTKLLINKGNANVDARDHEGNTPLHLAIHNQLSKCAEQLISGGADVCVRSNSGEELVPLLVKKLPDTMTYLLNQCINVDENDPKDEQCVLKVDFSPLVGNPKFKTAAGRTTSVESSTSFKDVRVSWQREMKVLLSILENPATRPWRSKILTHPVVQIFMEEEWKRARKFFYCYFFFYIICVLYYTACILNVYLQKCPSKLFLLSNQTDGTGKEFQLKIVTINATFNDDYGTVDDEINDIRYYHPTSSTCEIATGLSSEVAIILTLTIILAVTELGKLIINRHMYVRSFLNLGSWIFIVLVFLTTVPNLARQKTIGPYQYQAAALTVFLAWAFILQQIGRFPSLGKYAEMFGVVLHSFGFFVLTFISLFIAFALAFCILFPTRRAFRYFFSSVLKTFVMMTGEIDYNTMFYTYTSDEVKGSLIAHVLFAAFVFIVSIVLMNLVIGLTVQDIQQLQAEGELRRMHRLILEIHRLECFFFSKRIPRRLGNKLKELVSVLQPTKQNRREGLVFKFRPNSSEDTSVPEHLKQQALQLASISYDKFRANECSSSKRFHIEGHPVLMRRSR